MKNPDSFGVESHFVWAHTRLMIWCDICEHVRLRVAFLDHRKHKLSICLTFSPHARQDALQMLCLYFFAFMMYIGSFYNAVQKCCFQCCGMSMCVRPSMSVGFLSLLHKDLTSQCHRPTPPLPISAIRLVMVNQVNFYW